MAYGTVNADVITTSTAGGVLGAGNASIMKNRIINGAMVIDQRGPGTYTPNGSYTLDRWQGQNSQTSKYTVQQNAGSVTPPAGFKNYLGVTSSSAYSVLTGDYFFLAQTIEGYNIADLGWGASGATTVTLSFWVRSSLTGTFGGAIRAGGFDYSYPFTYTISSANTWEQKSVTITGATSGTFGSTNGNGLQVCFGLGAGSTYSGTAGSWAASNVVSATGATSVVGTNGATFYITGVQLEVGSSATGFEYVNYQTSLANCQRYFQVIGDGNTYSNPFLGTATFDSTTACYGIINFVTVMRTSPTLASTVTTYRANIGTTNGNSTTAPTLGSGTGNYNIRFDQSGYSGFTANTTGVFRIFSSGYFAVSAEL